MAPRTLASRGREVSLRLSANGKPVKNFPVTNAKQREDAERTKSAYLGEKTKLVDRIHNGWDGSFDVELTGKEWHDVEDSIIKADKDRVPPIVVNLLWVEYYRDGTSASWTFSQLSLQTDTDVPDRNQKVKLHVEWSADERIPNQ